MTGDHIKLFIGEKMSHDCDYYVCGPREMMQSVLGQLKKWGVPEERVMHEYFGPAE